jgi:hypothetical protein
VTSRLLAAVTAGLIIAVIGCAGALGAFVTGDLNTATASALCDPMPGVAASAASPASLPVVGGWTPTQLANAAVIVDTGAQLGVPVRGWVIAVATAMQESSLHNYGNLGPRNDHDSLGLFQQRPSQGWGTPAQILDPRYAATAFYRHLLKVPGWQTLPLTVAAQAVQRSAFPDAYAKWEQPATDLVAALTGITENTGCPSSPPT